MLPVIQPIVRICVLAFVILGTIMPGGRARAQSDADLRRENQQLSTQISDLTQELEALKSTNQSLQERIAQLEAQLAAARRSSSGGPATLPPLEEPEVTIDESKPEASPRAMLQAVQASHDEAIKGMEIGREGDGKRRAYLRKLEQWEAGAERSLRSQISWHVREVDRRNSDNNRIWTLVAVDPKSGAELGDPFEVMLPRNVADRLAAFESREELGVMVMRGTALPQIRVNQARAERGSFDRPRFIGPYVEYALQVEVKSLLPFKEDKDQQASEASQSTTQPASPSK